MENNKPVKDPYRSALKKKAMTFMPKNYEDINAQKQILAMIVAVLPGAAGIAGAAESSLWPKVQTKSLPIIQAVGQCALEINKIIAAAPLESLLLEKRSSESLMKAWVALDYYSYLMLPEYSGNIRALRDRMFAILRQRDTGAAPAAAVKEKPPVAPVAPPAALPVVPPVVPQKQEAEDLNKTVMVERAPAAQAEDLNKTVMVEREPQISAADMKTQFSPRQETTAFAASAQEIGSTVSVAREETPRNTKNKKPAGKLPVLAVAAVVAVVAVVALVLGLGSASVTKVEEAIAAIGTVTPESQDEILAAEELYEDLSAGNQKKVENRETLFAARNEYDRQTEAVEEVVAAIDAISSPVTIKSGTSVQKARKLYDALDAELKSYVSNYATLKSKEEAYTELYNEEQAGSLYTAAKEAFDSGDYDTAISKVSNLLDSYPGTSVDQNAKTLGTDAVVHLAQQAMNENRLEDAKKLLDQAADDFVSTQESTDLYDKLITKLEGSRPANGKMFRITTEQGYCKMVITAKSSDVCIKLISKANSDKYALYYIREGETFAMYLKDGEYTMHYAFGDYWYGETDLFGEDGTYVKVNHDFELNTYYSGYTITYEYYEFTLNTASSDMSETTITRNQF